MGAIRLYVQLEEPFAGRYQAALRRVNGVNQVEQPNEAHAVIADDRALADSSAQALWLPNGDASSWPGSETVRPAAEWRFRPSIQVIADALSAGNLGEPGLLRIHRWGVGRDLLADIDLACWLFGEAPETVYALEQGDYQQCHLGFREGGMAVIDHAAGEGYESMSVIGGQGAAYVDDHRNTNLRLSSQGCQGLLRDEGDTGLVAMLTRYVAALKGEGTYPVTMKDLMLAAGVVDRVKTSIEKREVA